MKLARDGMLAATMATILLLSSCAPTPTLVATQPPATQPPATELPTSIPPSPTIVPISLAGPQGGNEMTWVDGSTLVYIPPSEFKMGNGGFDAPERNVTVSGYWMYQTKVTNRMYTQCVATGSCTAPTQELGGPVYSNPEYANHPVVGVTWDQAQAYCSWSQGRLPTEAEWEKAARGIQGDLYPWGNEEPACDILNFTYCTGHTTEVDAYEDGASSYGILDLAGNVFEWVNDWYGESYYSEAPLADPTGPETGEYRVIRGSSFETDPNQVESAIRHFGAAVYHSRDVGFRCVLPEPKPLAPYCQLSAYVPTGVAASSECQLPETEIRGQYCAAGTGFVTIDIPDGAAFDATTNDFECTEAVLDGQRRLTCTGPRDSTGEVTVCNPGCSTSPDVTGAEPVCDPGYTRDPNSGACNYTPIVGQVGVAGCPAGYAVVDRGGQQSCVVSAGANGQCPAGLYFDTLAGYDPLDPVSIRISVDDYSSRLTDNMEGRVVALATGEYIEESDPEIVTAVCEAAKVFESMGARIEEVELPWLRGAALANGLMTTADGAAYHRERLKEHADWFGADVRQRLETGAAYTSTEYALARRTQTEARRACELFFESHDLLLLPTTPIPATLIEGEDAIERARQLTRFTAPFNLTGLPALSLPCGFTQSGLPIGLQIVSRAWNEAGMLQAGYAYEKTTDWHKRKPNLSV